MAKTEAGRKEPTEGREGLEQGGAPLSIPNEEGRADRPQGKAVVWQRGGGRNSLRPEIPETGSQSTTSF